MVVFSFVRKRITWLVMYFVLYVHRFPFLLPILKPDYAVRKIMAAFNSNQHMLIMPRIVYIFYFLQGWGGWCSCIWGVVMTNWEYLCWSVGVDCETFLLSEAMIVEPRGSSIGGWNLWVSDSWPFSSMQNSRIIWSKQVKLYRQPIKTYQPVFYNQIEVLNLEAYT